MLVGINTLACVPGRSGGDATYVRALAAHLPAVDPSVHYALFAAGWNAGLFQPAPNVLLVPCAVPPGSFVVRALWEQALLPLLAARAGVDVFHAPVNVAPLAAPRPIVLTLHEAEPFLPWTRLPGWLRLYWQVMRRASVRRARRILATSEFAAAEISATMHIPRAAIRAIPLGVDTRRFSPAGPRREPGGYLLWVGQSYPRKNLDGLVRAYALLARAGRRPPPLHILGASGWRDAQVRALVSVLGLERQVRFEGWVPDADLAAWYRGATLLVVPSLHEGFGLPVLEAMACGTPVLCADQPALREVGGAAALYADARAPESLAAAIERVLADEALRRQFAVAGPERAARFSWYTTAARTLEVYRAAVAG